MYYRNNNMVYLNLRAFIMSKTSFALMVMVLVCLYILPIMSLFWQVDMINMQFIAVYAIEILPYAQNTFWNN